MNKPISFTLVIVVVVILSSCGFLPGASNELMDSTQDPLSIQTSVLNMIKVPDLSNVDDSSAKLSITNKGLLPVIEYEYSDTVAKGNVVRTDPSAGSIVEPDTKVTLYVSSGPKSVEAKDGTIEWYHIDSSNPDEWNANNLMIYEGDLYICCETTFGTSFTLKSSGFGNASLTDSFDKYVPLALLDLDLKSFPNNTEVKAGEPFNFFIKIPLSQLDSERPTHVVCEIVILIGEKESQIKVSFNASW